MEEQLFAYQPSICILGNVQTDGVLSANDDRRVRNTRVDGLERENIFVIVKFNV